MAGFESSSMGARATELAQRLTPLQRVALGATVLTVVAGAFVLVRSGPPAQMAPLYTDLEAADAAEVTDELMSRGVDYDLADGGRTVLVPEDDVYDLRIAMSGEGLPNSNEGYALLDEQGITTSEFRQRIDYQRALEGELARTLRAIDGVDAATVHLALPEDSVFVDEPADPTASVLVDTRGTLDGDQVQAMVHLVASSVKDMSPEDVTIADSAGTILSAPGVSSGGLGGGSDVRTKATTIFEQDLSTSLRSMIGRVTGPDKVAVHVDVDLDLDEAQQTSERYDGPAEDGNGLVVSEIVGNETFDGVGLPGETGVLGPDGVQVGETAEAGESSYTKDDTSRSFVVDRTVEQTTKVPGSILRLNVAVLVDQDAVSEESAAAIADMVTTAAGIDAARGDQVVVTRLAFDSSTEEAAIIAAEEAAAEEAAADQMALIRTAAIAFIVLLALFLAYRSARKARREVVTPIDIGEITASDDDDRDREELEAGGETVDAPKPVVPELSPVTVASNEALDELSAMAERRPEDVAEILRNWLGDGR